MGSSSMANAKERYRLANHFTLTEASQRPTVVLQGIVDHYALATYIERVHIVIVSI